MYKISMSLETMPRPLTEDERYFLRHEFGSALDWLHQVIHWLAAFQTILVWQKRGLDRVTTAELWPRYDEFYYRWFIYYGRVYISVKPDDWKLFSDFHSGDWRRHRAVDKDWPRYNQEFLAHYADALDELIRDSLPGIKQKNSLQVCAMPAHNYEHTREIVRQPRLYICERIGSKWICEDCMKVYGLEEMAMPPLPEKRRSHFDREWSKLIKQQRRLEILERDGFTCQRCRRSPLQEYGVVLAVQHIVPVIEGGKTTSDNLVTLCADCQRAEGGTE